MSAPAPSKHVYQPADSHDASAVLDFIAAHRAKRGEAPAEQFFLAGNGEQIPMSPGLHSVLSDVLRAMQAGQTVVVAPQEKTLSTQEAAEILGVSRPTVVKLIDSGTLPATVPGVRRRRVRLDDVLELRARRRDAQMDAIIATSRPEDDDDLAHFATAKKKAAAARRANRA